MYTKSQIDAFDAEIDAFSKQMLNYLHAIASLSTACSFTVLLTGILFKKHICSKKAYTKIIMQVSLMNFLGTFIMAFGYPKNNTLCKVQGFVQYFCFRASWLWATMLSVISFVQVKYGKIPFLLKFRCQCIGIYTLNIILEIFPLLLGNRYGNCDHGAGFGSLGWLGKDPRLDQFLDDQVWLFLCIATDILLPSYLLHFTLSGTKMTSNPELYSAIKNLILQVVYVPVLLILCWGPNTTVAVIYEIKTLATEHASLNEHFRFYKAFLITETWCYLYGVFLAFFFFALSKEARDCWTLFAKENFPSICGVPDQALVDEVTKRRNHSNMNKNETTQWRISRNSSRISWNLRKTNQSDKVFKPHGVEDSNNEEYERNSVQCRSFEGEVAFGGEEENEEKGDCENGFGYMLNDDAYDFDLSEWDSQKAATATSARSTSSMNPIQPNFQDSDM